jgi:replicative DNA helicase
MPKNRKVTPIIGKIEGTNLRLYNWNGWGILVGTGHNTHILDEIQHRRKNVKQNMMLVVGSPGEGKSYFALRLAQIFDPKFDTEKQVVFERTHLLHLVGANSPLKMGQAIIIDEAQFIAGARRWYEDVQKDVMEHIEAIRSKGFIIIIVALHLNLLDKIIRQYVLSHMIIMQKRGIGRFYHLWTPHFANKLFRKRLGFMSLKLPDVEKCEYPNCLICRYRNRCMTIRAIYERLKKNFLNKMNTESSKKAEARERRKRHIDYDEVIKQIVAKKDELVYNRSGRVEPESIKIILEKQGISLFDTEARKIVKRGYIKHPEVFRKSKEKDR